MARKERKQGLSAAGGTEEEIGPEQWSGMSEEERSDFLQHYRLAYRSDAFVNWCPELGTVLANDEVKDGFSERGGHPVERKKMTQWSLRITAYAERLLKGLDTIALERIPQRISKALDRTVGGRSLALFPCSSRTIRSKYFPPDPTPYTGLLFWSLHPNMKASPNGRPRVQRANRCLQERGGSAFGKGANERNQESKWGLHWILCPSPAH